MATTTSDQGRVSAALSIWARRPPEIVRAALAIQKIIQVTKTTATIDNDPPISSSASKVRPFGPKVNTAPKARETAVAIATPSQIRGSRMRRSDLTRYAIRMLTTSAASSPSRSPIRKLANICSSISGGLPCRPP
jgi:hypothetical protein